MPIETTNYMILGFAVTFGAIALHLASFPLRVKNLKADYEILKSAKPAKKTAPKKVAKKTAKKAAKKTAKRTTRR
ncbi:MAG: hypothetical protein KIT08_02155 [Anaerolineales bacterium]|nr:MAG: hypothetical protein KIT08_02155 [Anaerolineales bacterium]